MERWVQMGAPDPRDGPATLQNQPIDLEAARDFWSFKAVSDPAIPKDANETWPENSIDYFILSKLEQNALCPAEDADREDLLRRVTLDLVGLPPTIEEIGGVSRRRLAGSL